MNSETTQRPVRSSLIRGRIGLAAVIGLAVAAGLVAWFLLRDEDGSSGSSSSTATGATESEIEALPTSVQHPVFWLGPKEGFSYELSQTQSGKIYIRYLPEGVGVGTNEQYLTVATYPFPGAYAAVQREAARKGAVSAELDRSGLAVLDGRYPESVHIAYPGVDYQVEVFDPKPALAMRLVSEGQMVILGDLGASAGSTTPGNGTASTGPTLASQSDLKALAGSMDHAIYWLGPKKGFTYELTRTTTGKVFIRYLPGGVKVGASESYLTVATYPFPDAFAAVQREAQGKPDQTIELSDGGLAVIDSTYPKSIHIAYPVTDYQIEVFDPSPAQVRQIVSSGQVTAIR